jgi:hypothetical protein
MQRGSERDEEVAARLTNLIPRELYLHTIRSDRPIDSEGTIVEEKA